MINRQVSEKALEVGRDVISKLSIQAFPRVIQIIFRGMSVESKEVKIRSLHFWVIKMIELNQYDRDLLSSCLPELIKALTNIIYDTRQEVSELAEKVLRKAMRGITNRDLEPFVEDLINAMKDRDETEETIQKLGGIVFVQTVEGSALSVVIPLMIIGFRESKSQVKRMCSNS